jgi:hypothetical protein
MEKLFDLLVACGELRGNLIQQWTNVTFGNRQDRSDDPLHSLVVPGSKGPKRTRDGSGFSAAFVRLTWIGLRSWAVVRR